MLAVLLTLRRTRPSILHWCRSCRSGSYDCGVGAVGGNQIFDIGRCVGRGKRRFKNCPGRERIGGTAK